MMTRTYQEFEQEKIDLDEFENENFDCLCPECGFLFNEIVKEENIPWLVCCGSQCKS
ncbi:hypothetical protein J2S13_000795 [Oikeobacillus pervagus]|uniref:Uncharacterized protein n=1 Tax=Oikeobacillus pervagus TaxID=1325931 RepID=A0AAJ1SXE3_9BACI|nr:hypothetical protein [Oikeobacillus pervagus]MDQ0214399.1 hypothetical protein [Oikeobacillus pervagus]